MVAQHILQCGMIKRKVVNRVVMVTVCLLWSSLSTQVVYGFRKPIKDNTCMKSNDVNYC